MVQKSLASFARHKLSFNSQHRVGIAILVNDTSLVRRAKYKHLYLNTSIDVDA